MSRVHYLCSKCKLDKANKCDYECIQSDFRFYFCPKFIYYDGTQMTNADMIHSMTDEELAAYIIRLTEVIQTCEVCEPIYRENGNCNCHCENGVLRWLKMEIK